MADQRGRGQIAVGLALVAIVILFGYSRPAYARKVSGTFAEDLPLMKQRAVRDREIVLPGRPRQRVERAVDLISSVQQVVDGDLFTVDTGDDYIGIVIRLRTGMNTRKTFESADDEGIVVEYYEKAKLVGAGLSELWRGNVAGAIKAARVASEKYPDYGPGWTSLGMARAAAGEYDEALVSFNRAKRVSSDPQAYHGAALTYIAQGRDAEAEQEIRVAVAFDPELRELSEVGIQYFRVSKPVVWGKYRTRLGGKVPAQTIERAFGGTGRETELPAEKAPRAPGLRRPEGGFEKMPLEEREKAAPSSPEK